MITMFKETTKSQLLEQLLESVNKRFESDESDFSRYRNDPVSFGEELLGESFTPDVRALMESVRDNQVTVAKSANATGKTHAAARVAAWFYKVFPGSQVYTAAAPPESNLKKLLWGELGSITEKHSEFFKHDDIKNLHISRSAASFITGVTIPSSGTASQRQAKFSGKHAPYLLFILDEADAIPDEVFLGIESCLSGGHGRLLCMFNPRAEIGEVYRMERDGRANVINLSAFNHPNVLSGEDQIPGAVTRDVTIRRISEWCRPLINEEQKDSECFELPKFLEGASTLDQAGNELTPLQPGWYKVTEQAFSYMVLGKYPAAGSTQLISREWLNRARSRWDSYVVEYGEIPPQGTSAKMGLDVGEYGTDSNCACFRYGGFTERFITWGGIDVLQTADRAVVQYRNRNISYVAVDATGVGSGVGPAMQRQSCRAHSVKVASKSLRFTELGEFALLRDELWWSCREWLRIDPGAMLPPDNDLIEELLCPTYEVANGKIKIMQKKTMRELLKRSPDKADSLCLTFYQPELLFPNL